MIYKWYDQFRKKKYTNLKDVVLLNLKIFFIESYLWYIKKLIKIFVQYLKSSKTC